MSTNSSSITKFVPREIPLNKLVPSPENVRKTARAGAVEERAASILAHGLLQNLTVRPQLDEDRRETGKFEVSAGRTRLAALKLLASRKKIAKNAPTPVMFARTATARNCLWPKMSCVTPFIPPTSSKRSGIWP